MLDLEITDPIAINDLRYKCEVCNIDFFKKYLAPRAMAKNLEKHYTTCNHKHNEQRKAMGLPPERLYNFSTANSKLTELLTKLEDRIEELTQQVVTPCGITAPQKEDEEEEEKEVKEKVKERLIIDAPPPKKSFHIGINERTLLYGYDGFDYTLMRNVSALLTQLLYWIRANMRGDRLRSNAAYVDTTYVAIQAQMVHRINGYRNDPDEIEDVLARLMNIAEHDWSAD